MNLERPQLRPRLDSGVVISKVGVSSDPERQRATMRVLGDHIDSVRPRRINSPTQSA